MQRRFLLAIFAILAGLAVTLVTVLVDVTPAGLTGAVWYGLPLAWFYVIVYPGSPWMINWTNFADDLLLWIIICFMISFLVFRKATRSERQ